VRRAHLAALERAQAAARDRRLHVVLGGATVEGRGDLGVLPRPLACGNMPEMRLKSIRELLEAQPT